MKVVKGTILAMETGEYSDYGIHALVRVTKDFDTKKVGKQFAKKFPELMEAYCFEYSRFSSWLNSEGYIEDLDYMSWHIGSYARFENNEPY